MSNSLPSILKKILPLLVLFILGTLWFTIGKEDETKAIEKRSEVAAPEGTKVEVGIYKVSPYVGELVLNGCLLANRSINVFAEVEGRVKDIKVSKGDFLRKNETLVCIEDYDRKEVLESAEADYKYREREYEAGVTLSKKDFVSLVGLSERLAHKEKAQATLKKAQIDYDNTKVKAPFKGTVNSFFVEVGSYLKVGDKVLRFVELNPLIARVHVSEKDYGLLKKGGKAEVELVDGRKVPGKVTFISKVADEKTRTFAVNVEMKNEGNKIPAGLSAAVRVKGDVVEAHALPSSVLTLNDEGIVGVKVVGADHKVHFIPVKILSALGEKIWVAGLPLEVTVITVGQDSVSEGDIVNPVTKS